jgi:hypothetical protein
LKGLCAETTIPSDAQALGPARSGEGTVATIFQTLIFPNFPQPLPKPKNTISFTESSLYPIPYTLNQPYTLNPSRRDWEKSEKNLWQLPGLRRSAVEAIGAFINRSSGCRQGTILAPVAAWQPLPGSGAVLALRHFGTKTRSRGRAKRVTSDATDSDAAGIDSDERSDMCRAERSQLRSRKRALREQATPVWRAEHDPSRRPGDWASDNLPRRSQPARCRSRPPQDHCPRSSRSRSRSRHTRRRSQRPR